MKRLSKVIMAIGAIIALLAACCIDSPGIYGYLAGGVAILGGFIVGAGYSLGLLAERRRVYALYIVKVDEPDVVWIGDAGLRLDTKIAP